MNVQMNINVHISTWTNMQNSAWTCRSEHERADLNINAQIWTWTRRSEHEHANLNVSLNPNINVQTSTWTGMSNHERAGLNIIVQIGSGKRAVCSWTERRQQTALANNCKERAEFRWPCKIDVNPELQYFSHQQNVGMRLNCKTYVKLCYATLRYNMLRCHWIPIHYCLGSQ